MSTDVPAVEDMSREDLEEEVEQLRNDFDWLQDQFFQLEELVTGEYGDSHPQQDTDENGGILERIVALENGETGGGDDPKIAGQREEMLPGHQMYADLVAGEDHALGETQRRAATIFGQFVERVVAGESNHVDASGQTFSITSSKAQELLVDEGVLDGVKESSRPQVVARVMREVARISKKVECDCEEIGDCLHANIRFKSGRPNTLASPKNLFERLMKDVYGEGASADDPDDASEQDVEGSDSTDNKARQRMALLEQGTR